MIRFETAFAETRNGYVWRLRDGIIIGVSLKAYPTQEEAFEEGQIACFMYFFAEEKRLAKA